MARTRSILDSQEWKSSFGRLLKRVAAEQGIDPRDIAKRLDRIAGSTGRRGVGDWSRYVNRGRIPTEVQVVPLSAALKVPLPVMRVCAGYIDNIFECVYAVFNGYIPAHWPFPAKPKRVAMALLLSLFPDVDKMHIGNATSLFAWMYERTVMSNLTRDEGFLTGQHWSATWLYPAKAATHVITHRESPDDPSIVYEGARPKEPWTWYSMRALLQVDLAAPAASAILKCPRTQIPKSVSLREAQQVLHHRVLSVALRMDLATLIVNDWADHVSRNLAIEVREHLHPWPERTITNEAARWVRGEKRGRVTTRKGVPCRATVPRLVPARMEDRPDEFWL
jgi:hypothetical protein